MKHPVRLLPEKETKNTIRFREVDDQGEVPEQTVLRNLYVNRDFFAGRPKSITVTVEVEY